MMARKPRIFHLLQLAHSALFRAADKQLKQEVGITASQQGVLFVLAQQDGLPITDIAEVLKMGNSSLTGLIDRMTQRGLVRRQVDAVDGRVQLVFIEPKGREVVDQSIFFVKHANAQLLDPFTEDEQRVIERFLKHVGENAPSIIESIGTVHNRDRLKRRRTSS